jgi:hypothetical protein
MTDTLNDVLQKMGQDVSDFTKAVALLNYYGRAHPDDLAINKHGKGWRVSVHTHQPDVRNHDYDRFGLALHHFLFVLTGKEGPA